MTNPSKFIVEKLKSVLATPVALHEPRFLGNELEYVKECIETGWVSSVGKFVDRFEQDLANYTGSSYAVACVNGTAALQVALKLAGVCPGEEVLIPSLTFVATANAVSHCGATPHFVDCEEATLGLDVNQLGAYLAQMTEKRSGVPHNKKTGKRLAAIVPMHTFGHPVDLDALLSLGQEYNLPVVEDAAESLGSFYKGKHTGTFGKLGILSFNGNKIITTGGGGAILTNDEKIAKLAKHLTTTAKKPHRWEFSHDHVGYNYRLPNLNAALGCAQLEQLPDYLKKKRQLAQKYCELFQGVEGVRFFTEPDFAKSNYWLNVLLLDPEYASERDAILESTNSNGLMTRPAWQPLHTLPMYNNCPRADLSKTEGLCQRIINIPSSPFLGN